MRYLIIDSIKKLLFRIFKPINPIDFNGIEAFEHNLFKKISYTIREINLKKILNGETFLKILIIIKESFVYLFIIFLYPISYFISLTKFRFLHINTWQIGAYVQQLDTIIKANKLNKNYKLILINPDFLATNDFYDKFYSKEISIINNLFVYLIVYPFINTKICSINNWDHETINPKSLFNQVHKDFQKKYKKNSLAEINFDTKMIVKKYLLNKNISSNKKIVCLQSRDNSFYTGPKTRGANLDIIEPIIDYLLDNGFVVVRFVSKYSSQIFQDNKINYLEVILKDKISKRIQFSFINEADLVICYQGGIHSMNQIVKTPFLQINSIPININGLIKPVDKIIFKKFFSNVENKYLTLNDIIKRKLHLYVDIRSTTKHQVEIVDNSIDEILNSINEIIYNKKSENILSKKFVINSNKRLSFNYSDAKVAESFLKKNEYLLR